jgi:DNA-binding FadR family transcriptional regulator
VPFQEIATVRLYQQVAEQVAGLIRGGELAAGSRLPAERDLAKQLGVSRPVLREALIALEIAGLVDVRTGSGAYVAVAPSRGTLTASGPSTFSILAARRLIEGEIAAQAAETTSTDRIQSLQALIDAQQAAITAGRPGHAEDENFHCAIAAMTGNEILVGIVRTLWQEMASPIFHRLARPSDGPHKVDATLLDHRRLLAALATRDGAAARQAMHDHIRHTEAWLLDGQPDSAAADQSPVPPGEPT